MENRILADYIGELSVEVDFKIKRDELNCLAASTDNLLSNYAKLALSKDVFLDGEEDLDWYKISIKQRILSRLQEILFTEEKAGLQKQIESLESELDYLKSCKNAVFFASGNASPPSSFEVKMLSSFISNQVPISNASPKQPMMLSPSTSGSVKMHISSSSIAPIPLLDSSPKPVKTSSKNLCSICKIGNNNKSQHETTKKHKEAVKRLQQSFKSS